MKQYRKKGTTPMEPWTPDVNMEGVSVGEHDTDRGSPKPGDMIATNPDSPTDRWLIAEAYFRDNYEPAPQRELDTTDGASAQAAGVQVLVGDPMKWVCLCKAKLDGRWMKSTKAAKIGVVGCLVQTTTLEIDPSGARRPVDTLCWLPGVTMSMLKAAFS